MFLGIKYYINQAMNDIWTKPSIKTFRIKIGMKLPSLVDVSVTEGEISGTESEKNSFWENSF